MTPAIGPVTALPSADCSADDVEQSVVSALSIIQELKAMNRKAALARFAGSERLFADMARFFLDDSPEMLDHIRRGLETEDNELVTRAAHSLKGLTANFDAYAAMDVARQIEELARQGELTQVAQRLDELVDQVERLKTELRPYAV